MKAQIDPEELRKLGDDGMNLSAIGREFGVSRAVIARRTAELGIDVHRFARSKQTCREVVQDMNGADAVEFLLQFIERTVESQQIDRLALAIAVGRFTKSEGKLLVELSNGSFRSREFLLDVLCVGKSSDEEPGIKIVDVFICKIRRKLLSLGWPVKIETIWGKGYILNRLDPDFRFPWETVNG